MALTRTPPLDERIKNLQADVDAFIDARVAEQVKTCPGVPATVLRNLLTARTGGCQCAAYLEIKRQDDEALAREQKGAA
jgi:hypothetical protein